jgi:formate dehydrogenase major subunit
VGGANARLIQAGLEKLDWMVVAHLFEHETASFWKRPGVDPARIPTEVFVLPAASGVEREGSIVNSGRWVQWRYRAVPPIADSRPDLDIIDGLARILPIHEELPLPQTSPHPAAPSTSTLRGAEGVS